MTVKHFGFARDIYGNAKAGASVYVYTSTLAAATLTDRAGNSLTAPVRADANGYYEFYVAPGAYDVVVDGQTQKAVPIGVAAAATVPFNLKSYTVATLPTGVEGDVAYASDGRKAGEGAGVGTGVMVFKDATAWIAVDTGATVAA
jgi:hypothetical protein